MKVKCPYCGEEADWKNNNCPLCNKFALMPNFRKSVGRKKRTFQRERKSSVSSPWMLSAGIWNIFGTLTKLPRWVMWIGILAVIGSYVQVSTYKFEQPEAVAKGKYNISVLNTALDYFFRDCGRYPTTQEGLPALVADPKATGWKGPYIEKLKWDPWKRGFRYSSDGKTFRLFSLGPDGLEGTSDDFTTPERFSKVEEDNAEVSVFVKDLGNLKSDRPKPETAK